MTRTDVTFFNAWLFSRKAEPTFARAKLPLELGLMLVAFGTALYSELVAGAGLRLGSVATLAEPWTTKEICFKFIVVAAVSLWALHHAQDEARPIRLRKVNVSLSQITEASLIVFWALLPLTVLSRLDWVAGTPSWLPSVAAVGVYSVALALGLLFLWGGRRLIWIERTGALRQRVEGEADGEAQLVDGNLGLNRRFSTCCAGTISIHSLWEIAYFQVIPKGEGGGVELHKREGRAHVCKLPLNRIEKRLGKGLALRVHNNTLVMIHQVRELRARERKVVMDNGHELKVADNRLPHVRRALEGEPL